MLIERGVPEWGTVQPRGWGATHLWKRMTKISGCSHAGIARILNFEKIKGKRISMAPYLSNKKEESIQVSACYLHKESGTEHSLLYLVTSKEGVGTWGGGGGGGEVIHWVNLLGNSFDVSVIQNVKLNQYSWGNPSWIQEKPLNLVQTDNRTKLKKKNNASNIILCLQTLCLKTKRTAKLAEAQLRRFALPRGMHVAILKSPVSCKIGQMSEHGTMQTGTKHLPRASTCGCWGIRYVPC